MSELYKNGINCDKRFLQENMRISIAKKIVCNILQEYGDLNC